MKIGLQHPYERRIDFLTERVDEFWSLVEAYVRDRYCSTHEVVGGWLRPGTGRLNGLLAGHRNAYEVALASEMLVSEQGCAAVAVGCFADPGVDLARSIVDVPVIGANEASYVVARTIGDRVGFVTAYPGGVGPAERLLAARKIEGWVVADRPVRSLDVFSYDLLCDALGGSSDEIVRSFDREAQRLVAAGADVVVPGCTYLGAALHSLGYREVGQSGVPVIDTLGVVIELAGALGGLHRVGAISQGRGEKSVYARPPVTAERTHDRLETTTV